MSRVRKAREAIRSVDSLSRDVRLGRDSYPEPVPDLHCLELMQDARTLPFKSLVRMKLTSFRDKDRVHLRDMIDIGMIDESWLTELPPVLSARLQELLLTPDG